jgi:hypothetical protein
MRNIGGALGRGLTGWLLLYSLLPGLAGCHGLGGQCSPGCMAQPCAGGGCQAAPQGRAGCPQGCQNTAGQNHSGHNYANQTGANGAEGCSGCTTGCGPNCYIGWIDTLRTRNDARANARQVLRSTYGRFPQVSCHYSDGFEQAFVDLAEGGDGSIPPIPPRRYWNAEYRCPWGAGCAEEWFVGYEAGVAAADATAPCRHPVIPVSGTAWLAVPAPNDYANRHQQKATNCPDGRYQTGQ